MPSKSQIKNFNNAILACMVDYKPAFIDNIDFIKYYVITKKIIVGLVKPMAREVFSIYVTIRKGNKRELLAYHDKDGFLIFNQFKAEILPLLK